MEDLSSAISRFFSNRSESIAAVYLFGSYATGHARDESADKSDVDIALLLSPRTPWSWDAQLALKADLESALNREVDLVVLNVASPIIAHQVLKYGVKILDRIPAHTYRFIMTTITDYADLMRLRAPMERDILKRRQYA